MRSPRHMAMAPAAAGAAVAVTLVLSAGPSREPTPSATAASTARATPATRFESGREDCSTRSEANFPGAYTSPRNLVAGPLVLIGGAYTDAPTVRRFGGNKFPLLVKAGHSVTVRIATRARRTAGLAYGRLPRGETKLRDTYPSVTFVACRPGRPPRHYSPNGPSASYADGVSVTFWAGGILTRAPSCIPLGVYVDGAPSPLRVGLSLGRRCRA